ncbi:hypothetical protein V2J09_017170 [Rumex salicifolius]
MAGNTVNALNGGVNQQAAAERAVHLNWLLRYRYERRSEKDPHNEMRTVLLVVSALIAAVTFQAGVNPPGGVWQDSDDGHIPGSAIYSSHTKPFYVFLVFNTLALSASISVIISLTFMFPFSVEIWIATVSMIITYGSSVFAITPRHANYKFRYLLITAAFPLVARFAVQVCRYVKRVHYPEKQWKNLFGLSTDRGPYLNWLLRYRYERRAEKDPHNEMRTVLLVVSALIAAVTFQAGVIPPGGVWQDSDDGHIPGSAIYSSHTKPFYVFLVFNTLALSASISVIISLTFMFPFSVEVWIATVSMIITYGSSVFAITPRHVNYEFRYLLITAAFPLVARFIVQVCRYVKRVHYPEKQWKNLFGLSTT